VSTSARPTDGDLARLAGPLRVLSVEQLVDAGLSHDAIQTRVTQGRLQRVRRGVYLVGPAPPTLRSHACAAVVRRTAWVSDGWAGFLHGFVAAPELPVDVLVPMGARVPRDGVRVHRSRTLEPQDLTKRWGIPVTSAARAILDMAETRTLPQLERLIADAEVAEAVTEAQLHDVANRAGRRRAATRLRQAINGSNGMTLSEAERILRRLLREADLPQPSTNYPIGPYKADFCWPHHKLVVEFDSFTHHGHRKAFHHDRRRNAVLTAQGWSVMQITAEQLEHEPLAVVARVAGALTARTTARSRRA
jgi:very-short-patch-repair endonuclease